MDFLIASFGTSGDVMPVIRLGGALRSRGHRVGLVAAPVFRERAVSSGLDFFPSADESGHRAAVRDMPLLSTRYRALFIKRHAVNWNERLLAAVAQSAPRFPAILSVDRPFAWADLYCHSRWNMPCMRLVTDVPVPRHWRLPEQLPFGRPQSNLSAGIYRSWESRLRNRGWNSGPSQIVRLSRSILPRLPRLGLWPAWIVGQGTRLQTTRAFGFILEAVKSPRERPAGARPLLVFVTGTTGTVAAWEEAYRRTCIEICRRLDAEGILLGATDASLRAIVPPWFRCERFIPLERLLTNAAALVHHGGIGTSALALYHGVPQLVVPRVFGQPVNAELMRRLGVARVVPPECFNADTAAHHLAGLLHQPSYRLRSQTVGSHMHPAQDLMNLTAFIETTCQQHHQKNRAFAVASP